MRIVADGDGNLFHFAIRELSFLTLFMSLKTLMQGRRIDDNVYLIAITHHLETLMTKKALLVIDLQNDYFPHGKYPLWNTEQTLSQVKTAIARAKALNIEVIHVQHIADPEKGIAPFFNQGTQGVDIHAEILAAAPEAAVVIKRFADSFEQTNLDELLQKQGISELLLCGMMTQNCVTHTAISKAAEKYNVAIMVDCCTTVDEMIHNIALNAIALRVPLVTMEQVLSA